MRVLSPFRYTIRLEQHDVANVVRQDREGEVESNSMRSWTVSCVLYSYPRYWLTLCAISKAAPLGLGS